MSDKVNRTLAAIADMTEDERNLLEIELNKLKREVQIVERYQKLGQWKSYRGEAWISTGPTSKCPYCGR